jgi:hypothetical protein
MEALDKNVIHFMVSLIQLLGVSPLKPLTAMDKAQQ